MQGSPCADLVDPVAPRHRGRRAGRVRDESSDDGGPLLAVSIFAVYLVGVAHFVLLPLRLDPGAAAQYGPIDLGRLIELRPFFLSGAEVMPTS